MNNLTPEILHSAAWWVLNKNEEIRRFEIEEWQFHRNNLITHGTNSEIGCSTLSEYAAKLLATHYLQSQGGRHE